MKLDPTQREAHLAQLPAWEFRDERGGVLFRQFVFEDFPQAIGFMTRVAIHVEKRNHHPEWSNVYNRVAVTLTTHDAGGVTLKDIELARLMDRVAATETPTP